MSKFAARTSNRGKKMAILKIYSDITTKDEKVFYQWYGLDAVCYEDVDKFVDSIPEDDNEIDIRLFCNGGSCMEGWAMYDRLRQSGKEISVTVEGKAASMATVIMMAAPKKRRKCYQNASLCVHNPWMDAYYVGNCGRATADDLQKAADSLREEQNRILDLYVERCGCDREEMQALMDEDKYIDPERAKELGLVDEILSPISASKSVFRDLIIKNQRMEQNENEVKVSKGWLDKVLAFFGKGKPEDVTFDITLNAADGTQITVEREEGEPQVGDKAEPDGAWLMPEGETIVIEAGVITEIRPAEGGEGGSGQSSGGEETGDPHDDEVARLRNAVAALEQERDDLRTQLETANAELETARANARTEEQQRILDAVALAGGEDALKRLSSNYVPEGRIPQTRNTETKTMSREEGKNAILSKLAAAKKGGKKE